jgi:PTS system galactitol-specific IIA component
VPIAQFLKDELIKLNEDCQSKEEMFELMYKEALSRGYVSESFLTKIQEREENFPTGLSLGHYGIAIPHTDPEHVSEQFIGVVTLQNPITFQAMEDKDKAVDVKVILMLGLNEPHSQLAVLQQIMQVIQQEENYDKLVQANSPEDIHTLFEALDTN